MSRRDQDHIFTHLINAILFIFITIAVLVLLSGCVRRVPPPNVVTLQDDHIITSHPNGKYLIWATSMDLAIKVAREQLGCAYTACEMSPHGVVLYVGKYSEMPDGSR